LTHCRPGGAADALGLLEVLRSGSRAVGHPWNWKRIYRVYCALRLNLPRRRKKRVLTRPRLVLEAPPVLSRTWALDFMGDTPYDGRCYRIERAG
jgi:putative transposase